MQNIYCVVEVETHSAYCNDMPVVHAFTNFHCAYAFFENRYAELQKLGFSTSLEDYRSEKNLMYRFTDGNTTITLSLIENLTGPSTVNAKAVEA